MKSIEIKVLNDGDEVISSVVNGNTITLTIKTTDNTYKLFLIEKNENGLFKIITDYVITVTKCDGAPLIKTTNGNQNDNSVRAYTL